MFPKHCIKVRYVVAASINTISRSKSNAVSLYARGVNFLFKKNLFFTNSITSGIFMAAGDMITQEYEYRMNTLPSRYDWERLKRMFMIGCFLGSLHHYYYLYLDILLPKRCFKTVLQKVAGDQFFCAPLTIVLFFYGLGFLENKTLDKSTEELTHKFKRVYIGDCIFWPPVQCINFYFLPSQYRVFYINVATMVFDIFLCFMKYDVV